MMKSIIPTEFSICPQNMIQVRSNLGLSKATEILMMAMHTVNNVREDASECQFLA